MQRLQDYLDKLSALHATELLLGSDRPPLYRALHELLPLPGTAELRTEELERLLERLLSADEQRVLREAQHVSCTKQLDTGERVRAFCNVARHGYTLKLIVLGGPGRASPEPSMPKLPPPLMAASSGLIIVTGPAGSGKSALISRMLELFSEERRAYVVTAEDPLQYNAPDGGGLVVQRAVGRHCKSVVDAIETALFARAEVIACSSLSSSVVLERMIEAASSGALAIGELRAHNAVGAIEQLMLSTAASQRRLLMRELSECLLGVVALDLLPAKAGGRIMALELLTATPRLCALLREQSLDRISTLYEREPGMQSMDRSLLELASAGLVEGHEAYLRASDKTLFSAWA